MNGKRIEYHVTRNEEWRWEVKNEVNSRWRDVTIFAGKLEVTLSLRRE